MKTLLISLCLFLLAACGNSDPYRGEAYQPIGTITKPPKKPDPVPEPPPEPEIPVPQNAYSLVAPDIVQFKEELPTEFSIDVAYPEEDKVEVTFKNLPKGATFDEMKGIVAWTPDLTFVEGATYKTVEVEVFLQSENEPQLGLKKSILFFVEDEPGSTP